MLHDPGQSSQLTKWLYTPASLSQCRSRSNRKTRDALAKEPVSIGKGADGQESSGASQKQSQSQPVPVPVQCFAADFSSKDQPMEDENEENDGSSESYAGLPMLTAAEEEVLVAFYASKLPSLIGPLAQVPRLRRDVKVAATAALLFRRFFLSNSIMVYDPKAIMVASAFLASKVEDVTADVRYLEEGTKLMDAPVLTDSIIPAELALLSGIDFDLLCFHPHKAVLAFTEDLISFLKSERGQTLASFSGEENRIVKGPDLKPMHDEARKMIDDVIVSDIPLLFSPGQVGMAALMVANEHLLQEQQHQHVPKIDWWGYVRHRFDKEDDESMKLKNRITMLCNMLKGLRKGQHGCGYHNLNLVELKAVHKKLKKCRTWGEQKKKKKRKSKDDAGEPDSKRAKTEQ